MDLLSLLSKIEQSPEEVTFAQVINVIDEQYDFTPTGFTNGDLSNEANQNNGSCKIFAFAGLHQLTESQTLACFGDFYRTDVLKHPQNNDHQNIRNFMKTGWAGIYFSAPALQEK